MGLDKLRKGIEMTQKGIPMTTTQLIKLAKQVAKKFSENSSITRSNVIREVVRTKKLNLDDSIILADCIIRGFHAAGVTVFTKENL